MDLEHLKKDTTRTESVVENIQVNATALQSLLTAYISIGNMLDQIKKNAFYDKPFNLVDWSHDKNNAIKFIDLLRHINPIEDKTTLDVNTRIFHSIVGICTESAEMVEALNSTLSGEELDTVNLLEECFDLDWYQFIMLDECDSSLEQIWNAGFTKLKKRYPNKFTSEDAINRDLETERQVLEDNLK